MDLKPLVLALALGASTECIECPECPTWDTLKRAGVEIVCEDAFGAVPMVNYWSQQMPKACRKIKEIRILDKDIRVKKVGN